MGTAVRCRSGRDCARPPCAAAPRPARRCAWPSGLRELSAVRDAVVNGTLGREQAAVLTRLVGPIHPEELLASQDRAHRGCRRPRSARPRGVGARADRHALRTAAGRGGAHRTVPALPADPAPRRRRHPRHLRPARGRRRNGADRAGAPGPFHRPGGWPHRRTTPRRRADRGVRTGPAARAAARHRRAPPAAQLPPARRPGSRRTTAADQRADPHRARQPRQPEATPGCPDTLDAFGTRISEPHSTLDEPGAPGTRLGSLDGTRTGAATATDAGGGSGGLRARSRRTCATAAWTGPQTRTRIETILCDARLSRVCSTP